MAKILIGLSVKGLSSLDRVLTNEKRSLISDEIYNAELELNIFPSHQTRFTKLLGRDSDEDTRPQSRL